MTATTTRDDETLVPPSCELPPDVRAHLLTALREHPQNPRAKSDSAAAIEEMKSSIRQHGQLQPALVREDGLLISGHVRKWANEALGNFTMPCLVVDVDDATALALVIASNEHITPPDPFLEADAVHELMHPTDPARPAWTLDQVADALGRKRSWAARREQLRNLLPKIRELHQAGKLLVGWPVEWLEQISVLAKGAQEDFLKRVQKQPWILNRVQSQEGLDEFLREELQVLGKAPFDIHDPVLVPKAGACVNLLETGASCRKTTIARPGLFEDQAQGDEKTARCCDAACWKAKAVAHVEAQVAAAKEKHGKSLVVVNGADHGTTGRKIADDLGGNVLPSHNFDSAKASTPGAVPAARIESDGSVTETWVKPYGSGGSSRTRAAKGAKKPAEKTDAQRLKDSRELVRRKRLAHMIDAVRGSVSDPKTPSPPLDVVLGFVAAYEVDAPHKQGEGEWFHGDVKTARKLAAVAQDPSKFAAQLWARVRPAIAVSIARHGSHDVKGEHELAIWIAERIGLDVDELELEAYDRVKTPRFWPEGSDPAPKRKAGKKTKVPVGTDPTPAAAAATPGTCRRCGCTENAACVGDRGPCGWEDEERTICSACADDMGEELPPLDPWARDLAAYDRTGGGRPTPMRKGRAKKAKASKRGKKAKR